MATLYTRYSARFRWTTGQIDTNNTPASGQIQRQGSWSETMERAGAYTDQAFAALDNILTQRALMLPRGASIAGVRVQQYTIPDGSIKPVPGQSFLKGFENGPKDGNTSFTANHPNDAFKQPVMAAGAPNKSWFYLHALPDGVVNGGLLVNSGSKFTQWRNAFSLWVQALRGQNFGWIGRGLPAANSGIQAINGNVVTLSEIPGGFAVGATVQFFRCRDDAGRAVVGNYQITAVDPALATVTLRNLGRTLTRPSGTMRLASLAFLTYDFTNVSYTNGTVITKKIGASEKNYSGRRSKRK